MPISVKAIANEFLSIAEERGDETLSPMKLQKLLYFADGWMLALKDKPLFPERIHAWQYGPVIPAIYHEFKRYGKDPIRDDATEVVLENGRLEIATPTIARADASEGEKKFARDLVRRIWDVYGGYTAIRLANATHQPGTPWRQVHEEGSNNNIVIPDNVMRDYFKQFLSNAA
jgi:uncharacterized phage-associated protein